MEFEESLNIELSTIAGFNGKIFPLYAAEGEEPPFLIYVSSEGKVTQTLDGWTNEKEVEFEIHVIAKSYFKMKTLTKETIDKLSSFHQREIGNNGLFIKSISSEQPIEVHEKDIGYYRSSTEWRARF